MASPWVGGTNFIMIRAGGKSKGSNSGPTGKKAKRFINLTQNTKLQAANDKERAKTLPRVVKVIRSGLSKRLGAAQPIAA